MFTGIIYHRAQVISFVEQRLVITMPKLADAFQIGDSFAIDGICLTLTAYSQTSLEFDVIAATINATNIQQLTSGEMVHVEPAMSASSLLGGHIVSGHVDTTLGVLANNSISQSWQLKLDLPAKFKPLVVPKGSVAINGVSLTIQQVYPDCFEVELIPETLAKTNLAALKVGQKCNVEFDQIAKTLWHQLKLIKDI